MLRRGDIPILDGRESGSRKGEGKPSVNYHLNKSEAEILKISKTKKPSTDMRGGGGGGPGLNKITKHLLLKAQDAKDVGAGPYLRAQRIIILGGKA